jgi:hypothetical protein
LNESIHSDFVGIQRCAWLLAIEQVTLFLSQYYSNSHVMEQIENQQFFRLLAGQ